MSEYEQGRFAIPRDDDPSVDDASVEEPGVDGPGVEEPSVDELSVEEPSAEQPRIGEPSVDEPFADGPADEAGEAAAEAAIVSERDEPASPVDVEAPAEVEAEVEPEAAVEADADEPAHDIEATQLHAVAAEEPGADAGTEDPFEGWPQAQSATVIEDLPEEGVSVEHVSGEIDVPDGYTVFEGTPTGHRRTVAIVVSRFNGGLTNRMLALALDTLEEAGVESDGVTVMPVPGAFELPLAAMALAKTRRYACVIALGAIVRGETPHFEYIAGEVASGLQLAAIETGIPVSFGVLTVDSIEQGEARVFRAADAVRTALEMADVFAQLRASARPV